MELVLDYKAYREFFGRFPKRSRPPQNLNSAVMVVTEADRVVGVYSESEDLRSVIGRSFPEIYEKYKNRGVHRVEAAQLKSSFRGTLSQTHILSQVDLLRQGLTKTLQTTYPDHHPLFDLINGRLRKLFPHDFGFFIRLKTPQSGERCVLLVVKGKTIERLLEPDLSMISVERKQDIADLNKYLSEKYFVPVVSLQATAEFWEKFSESTHPWMTLFKASESGEVEITPKTWATRSLLFMKSWL